MNRRVGENSMAVRCLLAVALALVSADLCGESYQVGPGRAYTNLQAVVKRLAPGDLVEVDGDATYPGNVTFDLSGTAARPITIRGIRIHGKRPVISGVNGFARGAVVRFRADHYVFEGFEITGGGDPQTRRGLYHLGDQVTVRDCVVRDCPATGVSGAAVAGSLTLQSVEIHGCGAGTQEHQIYVASDNTRHPNAVFRMEFCVVRDGNGGNNVKSRVGRNEIYFNWIEGAFYHELDLIGAEPGEQKPGSAGLVREDSDVAGNVFYKPASSRGGLARIGSDGTGASEGRFRFVNNTAVFDPRWPGSLGVFKLQGRCESVEMHNNVFHQPDGGRLWLVRKAPFPPGRADRLTGSRNWVPLKATGVPAGWTETLRGANPTFADEAGFDFTPRRQSPLRDAAVLPTVSPTERPFVNALQTLKFLPPPRSQPGLIRARPALGPPDIGALEGPGEPTSSAR